MRFFAKGGNIMKKPGAYDKKGNLICELTKEDVEKDQGYYGSAFLWKSVSMDKQSEITEVVLPENVTKIGKCAFKYCYALKNISLPDGLTEIGESAFECCRSLKEILLPQNLSKIGKGAFWGCTSLKEVTLPSKVTKIEDHTFYYCISLSSVTLPESIKEINDRAFSGCLFLDTIMFDEEEYINRSKLEKKWEENGVDLGYDIFIHTGLQP